MMSHLTRVEWQDEDGSVSRLSDQDIRQFLILLATAGNETVTKLLATAYHELWRNPDERALVASDPSLAKNTVEELLRFDPPSQYQGRVTTREVEIHGQRVPEHSRVLLINGASGRDERKFADPDRFDVRREIDVHLGLGYGRHLCLGASLARLETRIAIEELLARFPVYEVPADGIERMHSSNVRGLSGLVLEPSAGT
jgi:cytochrome P450